MLCGGILLGAPYATVNIQVKKTLDRTCRTWIIYIGTPRYHRVVIIKVSMGGTVTRTTGNNPD